VSEPRRSLALRLSFLAIALSASVLAPAPALAVQEHATLRASFTPDRLGASTTIGFAFTLQTTEGVAPPPLSAVELRLPAGLNYTTTTLGLAICRPAVLLAHGSHGCPANSRLGHGTAYVEVPFGSSSGQELPTIQAFLGPPRSGNMVVLFYALGESPVSAQLVFEGEVLPDRGAFGSQLSTLVPPVTSVAGGRDVSVVRLQATIGPAGLTYYHRRHGHLRPFKPRGPAVPERCPRGGFPFAAAFRFQDGSSTIAQTAVHCPLRRH
jgi:hypothetical protein